MSKSNSQKQTYEDLISDNLRDPEYLQNYLTLCFNDPDPNVFLVALRKVARANKVNFSELAKKLNLSRQGLYKSKRVPHLVHFACPIPNSWV